MKKIFGSLRIFFCFTQHKKPYKSCPYIFLFMKFFFFSLKKNTFEILWSEVWKRGFQLMLILGLLGMYFDVAVAFVMKSPLLFRLAVAIPHCQFSGFSFTFFSCHFSSVSFSTTYFLCEIATFIFIPSPFDKFYFL